MSAARCSHNPGLHVAVDCHLALDCSRLEQAVANRDARLLITVTSPASSKRSKLYILPALCLSNQQVSTARDAHSLLSHLAREGECHIPLQRWWYPSCAPRRKICTSPSLLSMADASTPKVLRVLKKLFPPAAAVLVRASRPHRTAPGCHKMIHVWLHHQAPTKVHTPDGRLQRPRWTG